MWTWFYIRCGQRGLYLCPFDLIILYCSQPWMNEIPYLGIILSILADVKIDHLHRCTGVLKRNELTPCLAHSANLPTGLYILPSVVSIIFKCRQIISASTWPIFTIFAPNDRYLFEYNRYGPLFWFLKGCCLGNRFYGKIWVYAFTRQSGVCKRLIISQFQFKNLQWQYISYILCKNDEYRSSNPRDYEGNKCTFLDNTAKIGLSHWISH